MVEGTGALVGRCILIGILLEAEGLKSLYNSFLAFRENKFRRGWPSTEGVITKSRIVRTFGIWGIEISYTYRIGSREIVGHTAFSSLVYERPGRRRFSPGKRLHKLVDQFVPESRITIHYNPFEVEDSYVMYIPDIERLKLLGIGFLEVAGGALSFLIAKWNMPTQ